MTLDSEDNNVICTSLFIDSLTDWWGGKEKLEEFYFFSWLVKFWPNGVSSHHLLINKSVICDVCIIQP